MEMKIHVKSWQSSIQDFGHIKISIDEFLRQGFLFVHVIDNVSVSFLHSLWLGRRFVYGKIFPTISKGITKFLIGICLFLHFQKIVGSSGL